MSHRQTGRPGLHQQEDSQNGSDQTMSPTLATNKPHRGTACPDRNHDQVELLRPQGPADHLDHYATRPTRRLYALHASSDRVLYQTTPICLSRRDTSRTPEHRDNVRGTPPPVCRDRRTHGTTPPLLPTIPPGTAPAPLRLRCLPHRTIQQIRPRSMETATSRIATDLPHHKVHKRYETTEFRVEEYSRHTGTIQT